ncbi:chemotaxis protein CheW [Pokkaliibacter plantistimulans]|nr:chemotaxis protein CheW [Pokkaliibacter plantistimulans]
MFIGMGDHYQGLTMELLCFFVDQHRYALELQHVYRVFPAVTVSPLPDGPGILQGVVNVHGQAIGVVRLRERLGLPARALSVSDKLIWVRSQELDLLLPVDDIDDVYLLSQPKLAETSDFPALPALVKGVVILHDGLMFIQDLARLLSLQEQQEARDALAAL